MADGRESRPEIASAVSGLELFEALLHDVETTVLALLEVSGVRFDDINAGNPGVFVVSWNKWQWAGLPDEAAPLVGAARSALRQLRDFSDRAIDDAHDRRSEIESVENSLEQMIEQRNGSYPGGAPASDIAGVKARVDNLCNEYRSSIRKLPTAFGRQERLLVVDTSAILDRPDLTAWKLDGRPWTVVLLPVLHQELDDRKRDPRTRELAQKVINQIEEFDRRGDTFEGVTLVGALSIREIAISPDMTKTLPWLRPEVKDDAFIAGSLELMWADLTTSVGLVASDRNLRNKARLAGLGVVRPEQL